MIKCHRGKWVLLSSAVVLALPFVVCHLAGFREYTCILSGTYPSVGAGAPHAARLGLLYVVAYVAYLVPAPILFLGAALLFLLDWIHERACRYARRRVGHTRPQLRAILTARKRRQA
jgi:hypothetical protein